MLSPDQLREMSAKVNKGFESQEALKSAEHAEQCFKKAIATFEHNAQVATQRGELEAIAYEMEVPYNAKGGGYDALTQSDREMCSRIELYLKNLGFTTRIHGPYVDGGPSKPWTGYDLYGCWKK